MPKYRPETAKLKAKALTKPVLKHNLNLSAVARERGVKRQTIQEQFHSPIVQQTLAEYLNKYFKKPYIRRKFSDGLEGNKVVGYLNNLVGGTQKVSDEFVEVPDLHCRHKYLVTLLECQGHIKHNTNGVVISSTHLHFTNITDQKLLDEFKRRNLSIPEAIKQRLNANITD